jgi:hypothetical protein
MIPSSQLAADVHHRARRLAEPRFADMMPSLFAVNDFANPHPQFVIACASPHRPHQIMIGL